jgi:hypothetical protein
MSLLCKVPTQPMPPEVWEEYKQLTRRLDFLGWRYSEMWKFRADEISEMFADVIRETDDISK